MPRAISPSLLPPALPSAPAKGVHPGEGLAARLELHPSNRVGFSRGEDADAGATSDTADTVTWWMLEARGRLLPVTEPGRGGCVSASESEPQPTGSAPAVTNSGEPPRAGEVTRNLRWSFLGSIYGRVSSVVAGVVLARLLMPSQYGHFAIALFVLQILLTVNDGGIAYLLMRKTDGVGELAPTAVSVVLVSSVALYVIVAVVASPLATALGDPAAATLIRILCLALIVDGTFSVPAALLTRSFLSHKRAIADLVGFTVTPLVSVLLAALDFGAASLAWGWVVGAFANGLLILLLSPRVHAPGWSLAAARTLLHEGPGIVGAGLLSVVVLNIDYVVVGRTLGVEQLGFYQLAFNLSSLPIAIFSSAVRQVSIPGFAQVSGDAPLVKKLLLRSVSGLGLAVMPVCVVMAVFAVPGISTVYGHKWVDAAPALRWLAVLALLRVIMELAADFLVALSRVRGLVAIRILWVVLLIPVLAAGAEINGIRGVAIGHLLVAGGLILPMFLLSIRSVGIPLFAWAKAFLPGAGLALVLAVASVLLVATIPNEVAQLLAGTVLVVATYGVVFALNRRLKVDMSV